MLQPLVMRFRGRRKMFANSNKQSPRVWYDKFNIVVAHYGLRRSSSDHSIFVRYSSTDTIILIVYIDIVVIEDDHQGIVQLKAYLSYHFHMKDFSLLKYFLEIKVARFLKGLSLSQRKYHTDLLKEIGTI